MREHRRVLLRQGAHGGAVTTCDAELGTAGVDRRYAVITKRTAKTERLVGRVGVVAINPGGDEWVMVGDLVLRHMGDIVGVFKVPEGGMSDEDLHWLRVNTVEAGWARDEAAADAIVYELLAEADAMDVRLDG